MMCNAAAVSHFVSHAMRWLGSVFTCGAAAWVGVQCAHALVTKASMHNAAVWVSADFGNGLQPKMNAQVPYAQVTCRLFLVQSDGMGRCGLWKWGTTHLGLKAHSISWTLPSLTSRCGVGFASLLRVGDDRLTFPSDTMRTCFLLSLLLHRPWAVGHAGMQFV
eukprot:1161220-Pelagomonas_calceolata.AAC.8